MHPMAAALFISASAFLPGGPALLRHAPRHASKFVVATMADDDALGDELAAEFRKALSKVSNEELSASDSRVLDAFVEGKKGDFDAFANEFSRELDLVQEAIDARLEGELAGIQGSMMEKIDAAVEMLRRENRKEELEAPISRPAAASDGLDAALPADALIVVAGGTTALGQQLIEAFARTWRVRVLLPEGNSPSLPEGVETAPYAVFSPSALKRSMAGADAIVLISAAAAGAGGVEVEAVAKVMSAVPEGTRQLLMVSTHGVERTDKLPFSLQNMMGALDKQRGAEQEVILRARRGVPSYSVLRIGKLKGEGVQQCELCPGDGLGGEISMASATEALLQTMQRQQAYNCSFSIGALKSSGNGVTDWEDEFLKLEGPELFRRPLVGVDAEQAVPWLQEFARSFLKPGQRLTTPVSVQNVVDGVLLRFQPTGAEYLDFDTEETPDMKWASAKSRKPSSSSKSDGALLLVAESHPEPRIRVARAEMTEGVVVKEMSEGAVIARLEKELKQLENARRR
ncbi:hypothetical protein AB1Y20_014937 [Prymnesium parvum]|uniref:NAD(P)-binding domain-containing protein n=1 Tax=Prymnesium parvum TaxID=97485 RepID=A0AB34JZ81_PRYPA